MESGNDLSHPGHGGTHGPDISKRATDDDGKSPFLDTVEAAEYVRLGAQTLMRMRCRGEGPLFRYHGRSVVYHIDDLIAWSMERASRRTSKKRIPNLQRRRPKPPMPKPKAH